MVASLAHVVMVFQLALEFWLLMMIQRGWGSLKRCSRSALTKVCFTHHLWFLCFLPSVTSVMWCINWLHWRAFEIYIIYFFTVTVPLVISSKMSFWFLVFFFFSEILVCVCVCLWWDMPICVLYSVGSIFLRHVWHFFISKTKREKTSFWACQMLITYFFCSIFSFSFWSIWVVSWRFWACV